jgi:hypothetical protein
VSWFHAVHLSNATCISSNRPAAEGWDASIQRSTIAKESEAIEIEMQELGAGVTRGIERIVIVFAFKPSGLSASFGHVDYEQLWLYIYQGFAPNHETVLEVGAGFRFLRPGTKSKT